MPFKDAQKRREYARAHQQRWNAANPEKRKMYGARWRAENKPALRAKAQQTQQERKRVLDWLKQLPCTDCGHTFPPVCMDFDHVRDTKVLNVGNMVLWSWEKIIVELKKCELVCATCHRLRTHRRLKGGS